MEIKNLYQNSKLQKEFLLIIDLLKNKDQSVPCSLNNKKLKDIDWSLFLELARHHRVYPILYERISHRNDNIFPPFVMSSLKQQYQKNTIHMLYLAGMMELLSQSFLEKSINVLFLKGPSLSYNLYGDISFRTSSDLDLLVPLEELDKVEALVKHLGYVKDEYINGVLSDWKWRHHHFTYIHPIKKVKIEVHWRLNPGPGREPSFLDLWNRKEKCVLTKTPVYTLGKEDLFFFLVTHGSRHGWSRLRWLMDIVQLTQKNLNWNITKHYLYKYNNAHIGGQALILSSKLLNGYISEEMESLVKQRRSLKLADQALFYLREMINLHKEPLPKLVASYHKKYLFRLMSFKHKCLFVLSFLYPYPEDTDVLPLPKKLHFLYFPLRPMLWVWRKTRYFELS